MIARLVVRSIRFRAGTHLATALVLLAGTTLLTGLAAVLGTGLATAGPDRALLVLMPAILGGWAVGIVAFGTVSTVSLAVGQREAETSCSGRSGRRRGRSRRSSWGRSHLSRCRWWRLGCCPGSASARCC